MTRERANGWRGVARRRHAATVYVFGEGLRMDRTSEIARWPWRKWLLAGTAMAGSATIVGPVAVEGYGCASNCASVAQCPCLCDACAATGPCAAIDPDLEPDAQRDSAME